MADLHAAEKVYFKTTLTRSGKTVQDLRLKLIELQLDRVKSKALRSFQQEIQVPNQKYLLRPAKFNTRLKLERD